MTPREYQALLFIALVFSHLLLLMLPVGIALAINCLYRAKGVAP